MRRLRTISAVLFLASIILFGVYWYREKISKDQTGPVFSVGDGMLTISVRDGEDALLRGITASDAADGDVTDSIIVESISPFTGTGHRIVEYAAFDSDNHVAHIKRELAYSDYTAPRFALSKPLSFPMNATNLLEGVRVSDVIDGDITKSLRLLSEDEIDTAHVGKYPARLKVTNSAGGVSYLPVTIEIFDSTSKYKMPQIKLSDYIVYVERGNYFDEEDYLQSITISGVEYEPVTENGTYAARWLPADNTDKTVNYDLIEIESNVDTDVTGCYEVEYSFEDTVNGTGTGENRMYVVVIDSNEARAAGSGSSFAEARTHADGNAAEGGAN